jgi:hypothetical protein
MRNSDLFVILTCDEHVAELLQELLQGCAIRRASALEEVLSPSAQDSRIAGVVLDLDGLRSPVEAVRGLRQADPYVPVLALSSASPHELINPLHRERVQLVIKPDVAANVGSFARRACSAGVLPQQRLQTWLDALAQRCSLSASERTLAAGILADDDLTRAARLLGYGERALKQEIRSLLRKCQMRTVDGFTKTVLGDVLVWDGHSHTVPDREDQEEAVMAPDTGSAHDLASAIAASP